MNPTTSSSSPCPQCGQMIPAGSPDGLCPRCLMMGVAEATHPLPRGSHLPSREEIAQAFPEFEVGEMIGHGGMGAVFRVRQPKLERDVALKVLPRPLAADPAFAERFHREARALAKLNHPNIVTVHDFGERQGWYFLLMEFVDGVNLRQAMRSNRFSPEQALEIVPKICEALQYAHTEGVLHRDIKPENLLLDAKGRIKIADFGIAKLGPGTGDELSLTLSGARLGTVAYMAPEQIERPSDVDHRADIYSLGVVFYEMLTGELPIGRFAAPSEKSPVGSQVDDVVFRTLEKERARRYQSAGEMKTQVEALAGRSEAMPPPPPPPLPQSAAFPVNDPAPTARPAGRLAGPVMALVCLLAGVFLSATSLISIRETRMSISSNEMGAVTRNPSAVAMALGVIAMAVTAVLVLLGIYLGWKNLFRLRNTAAPRRGLIVAAIVALLPPFLLLWLMTAVNVRSTSLAWTDGIALTAILLTWFGCWINPRPKPWSVKAVLGATLSVVPLLFIAHGWHEYNDQVDVRWAQEMNLLQEQINDLNRGDSPISVSQNAPFVQELTARLQKLHLDGHPTSRPPIGQDVRVFFALAALFALLSTMFGWMARAELRHDPSTHRGLGLAKFAAFFWPCGIVPLAVVLMA